MMADPVYQEICLTANPAAAVRGLRHESLARLITGLRGEGVRGGIPGLVLGLAEIEAAERFLKNVYQTDDV